jgi:protein-glutamine gamma-glutamyltransferase
VGWLQDKHGQMEGHVARYQTLLGDALKGAKLLDANFDGKLDSNDLIFKVGANGQIDVQKVGEALRDKVKIAAAVVGACEAANVAGNRFVDVTPSGWKNELPAAFFTQGPGGSGGSLLPGVKPSDALNEIFKGGNKYECGTAMTIVYYKAILDLIGPQDFDRVCANMRIGPGYGTGMVPHYTEAGGSHTAADGNPLAPGDRGYITNWDVSSAGRTAGWSGENVVYLGEGKYYGHPFGIETAEHMIEYMGNHRNPGSTRPASHSTMLGSINASILAEDKVPG